MPLSIKEAIAIAAHAFEHMPADESLEYLILKGHLLAEEALAEYVQRAMSNPDPIVSARFGFALLVAIAEALRPPLAEPWLWPVLRDLNRLRNELVHRLEPRDLSMRVDAFSRAVERGLRHKSASALRSGRAERFRASAGMVFGIVSTLPRGRAKYAA